MREIKDRLYDQVARVGHALSSPKRLELVELLCQGEKTVETLASQADLNVKLASAHLKTLRMARLVEARKHGKYVFYRLAGPGVADLWVTLREQAEERLVELQMVLAEITANADDLKGMDRQSLLRQAASGEVIVIDLRPPEEYESAHLPYARSLPLRELKQRLAELSKSIPVVAYCRGPFCLMSKDAVALLREKGYRAHHLADGVAEWRAHGLPIEV
jgi:rhodanese-related sulfurtransferase